MTIYQTKQIQMDLEVEAKESADVWKATFDLAGLIFVLFSPFHLDWFFLAIETMTAKTGNFKSFNVFVNMLENAINQVRRTFDGIFS